MVIIQTSYEISGPIKEGTTQAGNKNGQNQKVVFWNFILKNGGLILCLKGYPKLEITFTFVNDIIKR